MASFPFFSEVRMIARLVRGLLALFIRGAVAA